jgi:hypothetical protein
MKKFTLPYTALPALSQFSKRLSDSYINNNGSKTLRSTLSAFHSELEVEDKESVAPSTVKRKEALMSVLVRKS